MQVQEELIRHANLYTGKNGKKRAFSSRFALSALFIAVNVERTAGGWIGTIEDAGP